MPAANDVFISYRREGGAELASLIRKHLVGLGYRVSLDVVSLRSGHFDEAIRREIAGAKDFVLLLTPGALDRCDDPDDWVRREIALALQLGLNIVPIYRPPFEMPTVDDLADDIRELPRHNALTYDHARSEVSLSDLVGRLRSKGSYLRANRVQYLALTAGSIAILVLALIWRGFSNLDEASVAIQTDTTVIRDVTSDIQQRTKTIQHDLAVLGKSRGLVTSPTSAADYYHNAMVYVTDGNHLLAEESFRSFFAKNQSEYYDPFLRFARLVAGNYSDKVAMQSLVSLARTNPDQRPAKLVRWEFDTSEDATTELRAFVAEEPDFLPAYLALDQRLPSGLLIDDLARQTLRNSFVSAGGVGTYKTFLLNPNDDLGSELLEQSRRYENRPTLDPMERLSIEQQIDPNITLLWMSVSDRDVPQELILKFDEANTVTIPLLSSDELMDLDEPFRGGLTVVELPRYGDAATATEPKFTDRSSKDQRIFPHVGELQGVRPGVNSVATVSYVDTMGRTYHFPEPVDLLAGDDGVGASSFTAEVEQTVSAVFGDPAPMLLITPARWMRTVEASAAKEGKFIKVPQHENVPTINKVRCDLVPNLKHDATIEVWVRGVTDDGEVIEPEPIEIKVPRRLRW